MLLTFQIKMCFGFNWKHFFLDGLQKITYITIKPILCRKFDSLVRRRKNWKEMEENRFLYVMAQSEKFSFNSLFVLPCSGSGVVCVPIAPVFKAQPSEWRVKKRINLEEVELSGK